MGVICEELGGSHDVKVNFRQPPVDGRSTICAIAANPEQGLSRRPQF